MYQTKYQKHKTKRTRRTVWLLVACSLVIIGAGIWYAASRGHETSNSTSTETAEQKKQNQQVKQQTATRVPSSSGTSNSGTSSPTTNSGSSSTEKGGSTTNTSTSISAIIDRANQPQSGSDLEVRATIEGTTTGTCQITLAKSGENSFTQSFPDIFSATTATCGSANIPISSFPSSGSWQVTLKIVNGSASGTAAPVTATIQK